MKQTEQNDGGEAPVPITDEVIDQVAAELINRRCSQCLSSPVCSLLMAVQVAAKGLPSSPLVPETIAAQCKAYHKNAVIEFRTPGPSVQELPEP